jgi:phage tail protein X
MDAGQLLKYGFDQKVVDVAKSWEPLRKATVNADESLWKGFLGVMSPKDADTAYKVYGRLNELTNQVLDGKLAASPELIQAIKQMKGSYLPEVVAGHIQDWIPSRNLFGWFDNPNFAEGRTLKIASKDWVPFLTEYTDGLQQVAKRKTLDEMLDGAALLDNAMSANNPFKGELTRKLGLLNDGKAALPQISKQLQKEMKYWTPVSNLADLGMLYELQLNKAVFQQGLKKYWLTSTDAIQNGWVKALGELPEDLVPRAVMASPGDIAGLLKAHQLEEKIPVAKKMLEQLETSAPGQLQLFNTPVGMGQVNQMAKHVDTLEALKTWLAQTQGNSLMHDVAEMSPELAKKTQAMFKDLGVKLPDTLVATRPDIVKDIKRMTEILDPKTKEGGALLQFYDKALGAWKKQATIIRMPFHLRNFWSNIPMMYMSGVNTYELPGAMAKAAEIQKGGSKLVKVGGLSRTADEWLQLAGGLGVRGRGLVYEAVGSHLVDDIAGLAGGKAGKGIFSTAMDKAYQVGEEAGRAIEDMLG